MKLKRLYYRIAASTLFRLRWFREPEAADAVAVLMAHGVHDERMSRAADPPSSSISLRSFEANVLGLMGTYRFISLDEAVAMLGGATEWRPNCVVLTFDDSLKCLARLVAPRLAKWEIPATFYISTDAVESRRHYWWLRLEYAVCTARNRAMSVDLPGGRTVSVGTGDVHSALREIKASLRASPLEECERVVASIESGLAVSLSEEDAKEVYPHAELMDWDDIRGLIRLGMTVASHTVSHPNLGWLGPEQLRDEFEVSRQTIEDRTQTECRHFCYPYGALSEQVCRLVRGAGYASAVTTEAPGWNLSGCDLFRLRRFAVPGVHHQLSHLLSRMNRIRLRRQPG